MMYSVTGRPSPLLIAQEFLRNALRGRATVLTKQNPELRYRPVRCSEGANNTVASILTERLVAGGTTPLVQDQTLQELRRELLDVVSFARGSVILDLQAVTDMDAHGAALLLHLRGRLVGSGEWPSLCGLSDQLRAATASVSWDKYFSCYATVDAALEDLDG